MKDYYDLYIIPKLENIDTKELYKSVRNTFTGNVGKQSTGV
ncbi:hypothetical protein N8C73_13595 (plasmid) [Enterococcus faecium]